MLTVNCFLVIALLASPSTAQQLILDQMAQETAGAGPGVVQNEGIKVAQPLTYGAALQQEVQRLQSLNEVYPPSNLSYFTPYGDRTILAMQFPTITEESLAKSQQNHGYGPPKHGHLKKAKDMGLIISQNFVYRENVRDYMQFSQLFANNRPSQDLLLDVAKMLAEAEKLKGPKKGSSDINRSLLGKLKNNIMKTFNSYGAYGPPPQETWDNGGWSSPFALVAIESRVKLSDMNPRDLSLTNGSVVFPSPKDPQTLTFVPFIVRSPGDVAGVFNGYQEQMSGLIPRDRSNLLSFLKLTEGIHDDSHSDGKQRLQNVRRLAGSLTRPRLPRTDLLGDDPNEDAEDRAKKTYWLYTSTIALRSLSPPPPPKKVLVHYGVSYVPLVPLVQVSDSYGDPVPPPYAGVPSEQQVIYTDPLTAYSTLDISVNNPYEYKTIIE